MLKVQRIAAVDEIEVISRHMTDLGDYLYEDDSLADLVKPPVDEVQAPKDTEQRQPFDPKAEDTYKDVNAAKRFDYLDFIVIDVPAYVLPWQERSYQLSQLFKQCKFTNKLVFAAGCGMAQLAYYCATETKRVSVINGL